MKKRVNIQRDVQSRQNIAQGQPEPEQPEKSVSLSVNVIPESDEREKEPRGAAGQTAPTGTEAGNGTDGDKKPRGKAQGKP